ncbi:MFS transporter [Rhodococcus sp. NPDC003348]
MIPTSSDVLSDAVVSTGPAASTGPAGAAPPVRWRGRHFHGVFYVLVIVVIGANMPSALYGLYRTEFGFSAAVQTAIFAVYVAGLIPALLLFGPLSDALGRRAVLAVAVGAGVVGAATLAFADTTAWLFLGRIAQGVAVGTVSAAGTAALVEHEPDGNHSRAALASSLGGALGAALGPLIGGAVAQYLPDPLRTPYVLFLVGLVPAVIALCLLPRGDRDRGARLLRLPAVPITIRRTFWISTIAVALAWGAVGLFQSVVPSWISGLLGVQNLVVGAFAAALVTLVSVATQAVSGRLAGRRAERLGLVTLAVGMVGLLIVDLTPSLALLFAVTAVVGVGHGLAFAGGLRSVNAAVLEHAPGSQGAVIGAFFAVSYVGLAVPAICAGVAITAWGMRTAVIGLAVIGVVLCAGTLVAGGRSGGRAARDRTGAR